jgi:hypothetical protein
MEDHQRGRSGISVAGFFFCGMMVAKYYLDGSYMTRQNGEEESSEEV